jgi:CDP-diacylglycerol--glycerol-3-phosphate 3-phosphatidyltransferase
VNIAHYFTFSRVFLIPFFPLVYLHPDWFGLSFKMVPYVLLLILLFCEISDLMDGFLARKKKLVSDLGKIIDPMADAITHISVFLTFTQGAIGAPLLIVFVLLYREMVISALRTLCALKGFALAAKRSGKIKAVFQAVVSFLIVLMLIPYSLGKISLAFLQRASLVLLSLAAVYSVLSAVDYFLSSWSYLRRPKK